MRSPSIPPVPAEVPPTPAVRVEFILRANRSSYRNGYDAVTEVPGLGHPAELIDSIYECAMLPELWPAVLDRLPALVDIQVRTTPWAANDLARLRRRSQAAIVEPVPAAARRVLNGLHIHAPGI